MKLLPFVAAAAAEKRFLSTAGKARVDTKKNLLFDTVINKDDGSAEATGAFAMGKGAVYIGGKDATSSVTGMKTGDVYQLAKPADNANLDATWKKQARNVKTKDGSAEVSITQATLPDCTNKFIEHKENSGAGLKEGTATNATKTEGAKDADLQLNINDTTAGLANADIVYLACSNKADNKKPKFLACGGVYTLSDLANGGGATATFKLTAKGATAKVKVTSAVPEDHTTNNTWAEMFFVKVASTTPKILNVCTAKASASRMAAFVSGLIAYALLI